MIYGIPLFRKRVAPRCTIADSILIAKFSLNRLMSETTLSQGINSWNELINIFHDNKVDTLVCGGIENESRILLEEQEISVIDNVVCYGEEVIKAIQNNMLKPGYGIIKDTEIEVELSGNLSADIISEFPIKIDCANCRQYKCLEGKQCELSLNLKEEVNNIKLKEILSSAADICFENERILCRLSELIYFALEMDYRKLGIAYCIDLAEPASIVAKVLKRFFNVYPVCCKIGGRQLSDSTLTGSSKVECNPTGQAELLNSVKVDFNIIIGLCMGIDSVFTKLSEAPVSTLFVKDKSLANNPIGAVYSDYYLKEVSNAFVT